MKRVGKILPSSRILAKKIVQPIRWNEVKTISELGPGTGSITRLMKAHLPDSATVILFERDKHMRDNLKLKYPEFLFHSNASYLLKNLNDESVAQLDCIICGLPFFNFSREMKENILNQIVAAIRPGGSLILYQHSLHMRKELAKHFLIEKIDFILYDIPPIFEYICSKKEEEMINS